MQTQVIPQYVNPPKQAGGKYGNIKLQDGTVFFVPANQLGNFAPNMPANIEYQGQTWGWGTNSKQVYVVTAINGMNITGQQGSVRGGDRPAAAPQNVPQTDKEEGMFIMGVVGRAMGSGQFGMDDILGLTQRASLAWKKRHESQGVPDSSYRLDPPPGDPTAGPDHALDQAQQGIHPDDEIPF